jgi:cytochrome b
MGLHETALAESPGPPRMSAPIWDVPTRLFHWLLLLSVSGAFATAWLHADELHAWFGLTTLGLLLFRLGWGFWGSATARFSDFLVGPGRLLQHLREGGDRPGHNPLGGLSVLAMLLVLGVQTFTGLFNGEDYGYQGPLYPAVDGDTAGRLGAWHEWNGWLLLGLIGLHLLAIAWYEWRRGRRLVRAMITGRRPPLSAPARPAPAWRAVVTALAAAAAVTAVLWLAPDPVSYDW